MGWCYPNFMDRTNIQCYVLPTELLKNLVSRITIASLLQCGAMSWIIIK